MSTPPAHSRSIHPLLQLNADAQTEYVLAEEIVPHGSTSEWIIRLRPGVTFHDGQGRSTADDVIFTFQAHPHQDTAPGRRRRSARSTSRI